MQSDDRPLFSLIKYINSCKQFSIPSLQLCSQGAAEYALQKLLRKSPRQRLILQTTLTPIWSMIRNKHNSTDVLLYVPQVWNK